VDSSVVVSGKERVMSALNRLLLPLLTVAALHACHRGAPATAPATAPAHEADHAAPHWSYHEADGPGRWSGLSPEYAACGVGREQSPIDIATSSARQAPDSTAVRFGPVVAMAFPTSIVNNGHTVQFDSPGSGVLLVGEERYVFQQLHFHSPSEHTIDGRSYPLEAHFVHKSDGGKLAVVAVLFEEGAENSGLGLYWNHLPSSVTEPVPLPMGGVAVSALLPASREVYRYSGSLTTPPCSEGVAWFVATSRASVSAAQVAAFRAVAPTNNRPVQLLGGRSISIDTIR
jgi:carbonic anhydrase